MRFDKPYFVTPHAVQRFRERVADIPAAAVIQFIQAALQDPGLPVDVSYEAGGLVPIYRTMYGRKPVYIPVAPGEREWPSIPTIYSAESAVHYKYHTGGLKLLYKKETGKNGE